MILEQHKGEKMKTDFSLWVSCSCKDTFCVIYCSNKQKRVDVALNETFELTGKTVRCAWVPESELWGLREDLKNSELI